MRDRTPLHFSLTFTKDWILQPRQVTLYDGCGNCWSMTSFVEKFNATYRKPHPFRQQLKELGLRQAALAGFLGIHTSYLNGLLAGMHKMPPHIELALQELIAMAQEVQPAA